MYKCLFFLMLLLYPVLLSYGQTDKEQLALLVSKADAANTEKLKAFIWKRKSQANVNGEVKAEVLTEFSFDESGKLQATVVDAATTTKQKRGVRGKIQQNAIESNLDYIQSALQLSVAYTYMTKGQLLDFFEKANITENDGVITASGVDIIVKGDKLTVLIDKNTSLFISKKFSSVLENNPIDGEIQYESFSSGVSHVSKTFLNLPAKKAIINAVNMDYSQRIN